MSTPAILLWDQAYNRNGDASLPRAVVNAIRTHANNHTLEAWVKAETLADYTGLQVRGVRKQIAANVKAGWLEIVKSGNSSGLATRYRLTYPKGVLQDRVLTKTKGVPEDTKGVPQDRVKGVPQDTPTTPNNYSVGTTEITTQENGVPQDTLPADPFGSGGIPSGEHDRRSTGQSNGVLQDTLPGELAFSIPWSFDDGIGHTTPWPKGKPLPDPRDPFTTYVDEETGEEIPVG